MFQNFPRPGDVKETRPHGNKLSKGDSMIRQGDVNLYKASVDVKGLKKQVSKVPGRIVLAYGEVTGHHHSIDVKDATYYEPNDLVQQLFRQQVNVASDAVCSGLLVVDNPTVLTHQDHGHIEVEPGEYFVTLHREYTPAAIVRVID
jgi:hypothetical protein